MIVDKWQEFENHTANTIVVFCLAVLLINWFIKVINIYYNNM